MSMIHYFWGTFATDFRGPLEDCLKPHGETPAQN